MAESGTRKRTDILEAPASLAEVLERRAELHPERTAFTFLADGESEAESLTYGELAARVRGVAAGLAERAAPGERALLFYPPSLDFVVAFLGCLHAGVVAVPCYPPRPRRPQERVLSIARDAEPAVIAAPAALAPRRDTLLGRVPALAAATWLDTDDLAADLDGDVPRVPVVATDLAMLQYTSGSTSEPKGVMVRHGDLLHNQETIRRAFAQDEDSVVVSWLPLYHDMGLIGGVLQPLYSGGCCVLMSPVSFLQRPRRWLEAVSRHRATTSGAPNFAYDLVAAKAGDDLDGLDLSSWKVAFNGAEPVRADTLERFAGTFAAAGFDRRALYPCYGLAEATLFVTGGSVDRQPTLRPVAAGELAAGRGTAAPEGSDDARVLVGCGAALLDLDVRIVDPETRLASAAGEVGEIWLRGPGVTGGYFRRPDLTAETFGAELAVEAGDAGEGTFLRTGDLGFLAEDGELFVTGRRKELLILRGRNHYPQDIEHTAEAAHPALRPGGSAAFAAPGDDGEAAVLVAEVSRRFDGDPAVLGRAVAAAVAEEHGVGLAEVVLLRQATLPKTTSGKKRRGACRDSWLEGGDGLAVVARWSRASASEEARLAAAGELDRDALAALDPASRRRALATLVAELAARAGDAPRAPAPDAPLSTLGLDSLAVIELHRSLGAELGLDVPLESLLAGPTAYELAAELAPSLDAGADAPAEGPRAAGGDPAEPFPLTAEQEALWFLHRLAPDSAAYNLAAAARLVGGVDAAALEAAVTALARRHPALAARFVTGAGEVRQVHDPAAAPALERLRRKGRPLADVADEAREEAFRPFDLSTGGPLRLVLFERGDDDPVLLLVVHHLVADFASLEIVARDLGLLYAAEVAAGGGEPAAALPAPAPVTYRDFEAWRRRRTARNADGDWDHWRDRLDGAPVSLDLPTDRPRGAADDTRRGGSHTARLADADTVAGLALRLGATPFAVLLAAFQAVLGRHCQQDDLLVGSPLSLRDAPEVEELVGYLVNPLPLRGRLAPAEPFSDLARRAGDTVGDALAHRDLPLPWLAERLLESRGEGEPRGGERALFQVLFAHQRRRRGGDPALTAFALGRGGAELRLGGGGAALEVESLELPARAAAFDLSLTTAEAEGGVGATLVYDAGLFDTSTAERLLGHLGILLAAALERPETPVGQLPLLTDAEIAQVGADWATGPELPAAPVPGLDAAFAAAAREHPDAVALVAGEEELTYGELARRASDLARRLAAAGVGPEDRVGVLLPRQSGLVVALLAVLEAGGAYVPLDPAYPQQRLRFMLADSGAVALVAAGDDPLAAALVAEVADGEAALPVLDPAAETDGAAAGRAVPALPAPDPDRLAYVIYTSGSTGRPKGVAIRHGNAAAMLSWARDTFPAEDLAGVLASTSVCFDLSVFEIFVPLAAGGTVVLADDALALSRLSARERVTLVNTVPSALAELMRGAGLPASVRTVNLAGEALPGALVRAVHDAGEARVLNLYGPSEDTTYSTWAEAPRGGGGDPTIGGPVAGTRAYVLDRHGRLLPAGVPGELYLAGLGVSRGYLGRPGLTAGRYLPDPFAGEAEPGARLYRTGDQVRWRGDGELDFLGRLDHQVKVRGFRIELGEVESVLAGHPRVREVVVVAAPGPGDVPRLVAYVAGDDLPPAAELRQHAAGRLPEHALPALYVRLEELPRTPNGKVDRKALPEPDPAADVVAEATPPRTPLEEVVAAIWADLFGLPSVGVHTSFFDLGGHSLLATRLLARVRDALDVELPLRAVFRDPTVAGLAARLEEARRGEGEGGEAPPLTAAEHPGPPPLSFAQERLWFLDQLEPGLSVYNVPGALRWRDPLDLGALSAALEEVARRHATLRTRLLTVDERPLQMIEPADGWPLPRVDLRSLSPALAEAEARRVAAAEARRPFDLAEDPLMRTRVLHLGEDDHLVLATLHHIASDGWSLGILAREVGVLYAACAEGRPSPLPELPVSYADFALWQREWLSGAVLDRQLAYWRDALAGAPPVLELPTDRPRPAVQSFRGDAVPVALGPELTAGLRSLGRRHGATLFMTLLAAFKVVVARQSGQDDLVLGTPLANRGRSEIESLIGFFVNTLVVRTSLAGDPDFASVLRRVRDSVLEVHAHQDLPLEKLVEELQLERDLSRAPLFQVVFSLQTQAMRPLDLPGVSLDFEHVSTGTSKFDVMLDISEREDRVEGYLEYASDLFDRTTMARLARHYHTLLTALVAAQGTAEPALPVSRLPLLSAAERHQLLVEANAAAEAPKRGQSGWVHQRFAAAARRDPAATAVVASDGRLTYGELADRAHRLAHHLRSLGVAAETPVALCLPRSVHLPVAMLGTLAAGGAFLPLDPGYPVDRLAYMLEDSGARVLITVEAGAAELADAVDHVVLVDGDDVAADLPTEPPGVTLDGGHLAYLIYTSGSTGRPKGVAVEHRQIASYVDAAVQRLDLAGAASYATVSTFAADLGHTCVFPALTRGATLHLVDEERAADPDAVAAYFEEHPVDVVKLVPSHLEALLAGDRPRAVLPRRTLVLGGEAWSPRLVSRLAELAPDCAVHNHYGPSETTVGVLARRVEPRDGMAPPDLGRPMAGRSAYLLGPGLEPVPPGAWGEIHLGGEGVARGYVDRPRLTAERFLPDPYADRPGARVYRTGDLGRSLHDGRVRFVGRADDQVKYHGYRIEPNEIRLALNEHPKVRDSLVLLRHDAAGRDALVAYYVCRTELDPEELRAFLTESLIEETVPNVFVHLRRLPLNLNGKVNRDALPGLDDLRQRTRVEHVAPRTPAEEALADIWSEVLGVDAPSVHDNFFQLGGHSLLATRVVSRIRAIFDVDLPLRVLFERPTIARLSVAITEAELEREDGDEVARMMEELAVMSGEELEAALAEEVAAGGEREPV